MLSRYSYGHSRVNSAKMLTLFVADIHLCAQNPKITTSFLHFLRVRAITAQALYILGDLFEIWIGDDDPNPLHHEIAVALKVLINHGIPCYFIHGNRDFLLGKRYAAACGITLLPAQLVIKLYGLRVVILHGDILCVNDSKYQCFRYLAHQHWLQLLFLSLPRRLRLSIADGVRTKSLYDNTGKVNSITDVSTQTVMAIMDNTKATVMIHGHTHQPAIHKLSRERSRAVLGAWYQHGSAIELSTNGITLHKFPLVTKSICQ